MAIFKVIDVNFPGLATRIEKLNKKAAKLGVPEVFSRMIAYRPGYHRQVDNKWYFLEGGPISDWVPGYYEVEVTGGEIKIPGWAFLGTIEHTKAGNILRAIPGQEISEDYRHVPAVCDHCKKKRSRKDTYAVKSEAGEIKQIGHNCIRDYLGHANPESLALMAEFYRELEDRCREDFSFGGRGKFGIEIHMFLNLSAEFILRDGYRSRKHPQGSTAACVQDEIASWLKPEKKKERILPSPAAIELATDAILWCQNEMKLDSGYTNNLSVILAKHLDPEARGVTFKDAGLLSSMIFAFQKANDMLKKYAERLAKMPIPTSEYVGEIKKRYDFKLTLKKKFSYEGSFRGTFFILLFEDPQGNVFKWGTCNGRDFYEGTDYELRGTVKSHALYIPANPGFPSVKQTILSRCVSVGADKKMTQDELRAHLAQSSEIRSA